VSVQSSAVLPETRTMIWWGLTIGTHTTYCLIMELLTRRTAGKALVGTRILSESGEPASAGQIVVRNSVRLLELLPPLWFLAALVIISRNRQRAADIFARTIVVRRVQPQEPAPPES
jgi:uncharacterized RDD family membrane protein YckC